MSEWVNIIGVIKVDGEATNEHELLNLFDWALGSTYGSEKKIQVSFGKKMICDNNSSRFNFNQYEVVTSMTIMGDLRDVDSDGFHNLFNSIVEFLEILNERSLISDNCGGSITLYHNYSLKYCDITIINKDINFSFKDA